MDWSKLPDLGAVVLLACAFAILSSHIAGLVFSLSRTGSCCSPGSLSGFATPFAFILVE